MAGIRRFLTVVSLIMAGVLTGCVEAPPTPSYPDITFKHLRPLYLDVGEIRIVDEFRPPLQRPHVEHELPVSINQSIRNWVQDRLQTTGNSGAVAIVTIKDASAVEKELSKETGLKGLVTKSQSELYEFHALVEIKINEISGSSAVVTAEATRSKSVPEGITLNEREKMYYTQVEALMRAFDQELEKNIRAFMGAYLR
ncbi:MAG: hypothetical protein CMN55_10070 [Sneathiella sp.]|uniref:hypothetical protein n=1 Tax=Sneathiella sp. TaxID=1964365 RepID=UPI000C49692E|nr:hypothetical protein [Sneathiella sp.]MAL79443.1 hypothetical protein [Sneathiella sp.]